jgi:hypothetical protein
MLVSLLVNSATTWQQRAPVKVSDCPSNDLFGFPRYNYNNISCTHDTPFDSARRIALILASPDSVVGTWSFIAIILALQLSRMSR